MELEAIRKFVQDHAEGALIRLIDGTKYRIPHRDWVSFGPPQRVGSGKEVLRGTSFIVFEAPGGMSFMKLVNPMLVAEVSPLKSNGNGHGKRTAKRRKP